MEIEIKIQGLNKYYGKKHALKDVNLIIPSGMYGLLGPNGAGKTTLMKVLCTLLKKEGGQVLMCGTPIEESAKIRNLVGYLPQDFSMYGNMTVYEALDYLGALSGVPGKERKKLVPKLLSQVNLDDKKRVRVRAMSGGMRRRLGIAQALIHNPKVLIVDEPTAGLDPEERVRFRNLLCEIAHERIVILSTHIVGDVEATCERIGVLSDGELLFDGTVEKLLLQAEGKIYAAEVVKKELDKIREQYVITSMLTLGNKVHVRFISESQPFMEAKPEDASVEDAYMYLMQQRGGKMSCS